jgi:hypothetical protein
MASTVRVRLHTVADPAHTIPRVRLDFRPGIFAVDSESAHESLLSAPDGHGYTAEQIGLRSKA